MYLTIAHYGSSVTLACPDVGAINCEKVTTSPQSVIFGAPVAAIGLAFFIVMVALNLARAWRCPNVILRSARVGLAAVGVAFAVYLSTPNYSSSTQSASGAPAPMSWRFFSSS